MVGSKSPESSLSLIELITLYYNKSLLCCCCFKFRLPVHRLDIFIQFNGCFSPVVRTGGGPWPLCWNRERAPLCGQIAYYIYLRHLAFQFKIYILDLFASLLYIHISHLFINGKGTKVKWLREIQSVG